VSESFRGLSEPIREAAEEGIPSGTPDVAFSLWSQTLLSREGYNSAVVLYSIDGIEMSRFSVGLTNYEQTQLLTRLFDVDEERLNVVERRVPDGLIKYYGMWGTIRNESHQPVAIAAVLISASERALFRGEASELLRTVGQNSGETGLRTIVISEYQNGSLVASNNEDRTPGGALEVAVRDFFAANNQKYLEREETWSDRTFESLYVRDDSQPGRIVSLSTEEVGLRWHVYNIVKVALVYAAFAFLACIILVLFRWGQYRTMLFGFRGKLLLGFLIIAVIPLIVFGYYNREFATERQDVSTSKRLNDDLDLIQQRIISSVTDAEDFDYGINSDYCETVASEYGIDFTVYKRSEVHASSKPELYQSGILDSRLPGIVFAELLVAGKGYAQTNETIGEVAYAVGYKPLVLNGITVGVVSVPTLYRQEEIESELAERNAFTLGVYGILLVLTTIAGVVLANQLSQPMRDLTNAAHKVGKGELDVQLPARGTGEIPELIGTFNEMVRELKKSREELSRAEREKAWKEMAKQVAHEIKNPLTPMKLSVQHLRQAFKDKAKNLPELVEDVTQTITEQVDKLARIATEFSHFARMPERRFERVNLHDLLKETVQLFREVRGIEFTVNLCDIDPVLIADRDELGRVFVNIVRNSVQAMEDGGRITVKTEMLGHWCRIEISDTGAGIPPHLVTKVFEPNFSTKTDGMGLGLAIVRKAIEDLNGTIEAKSTVDAGTTMEIKLPLQSGPHA
jgi:signal transduction histidine kinase